MGKTDVYYKKTINYEYRGNSLQFRVTQDLFSSNDIDIGTQRLLHTLTDEKIEGFNKALDLGCGYGPLGISLKNINPTGEVHMTDKDALALEYSRQNADLNNIGRVKIYGSLGYDDVEINDFDLIVSNIPAKVGELVLSHLLLDAERYLRPRGRVAIVVIDAIAEYVTNLLTNNPKIKILFRKDWSGHVVFHYEFKPNATVVTKPKITSLDSGIYDREELNFIVGPSQISIKTTFNLPEFDSLGYATELLIRNLTVIDDRNIGSVLVFNPGQGFVPVVISRLMDVNKICLVDRDLQALRISKDNLIENNYPAENIIVFHQVGILGKKESDKSEYVIGVLPEKDGPLIHAMFIREAASCLVENGLLVISSTSTAITRIKTFVRKEKLFNLLGEKRSKGRALLTLISK